MRVPPASRPTTRSRPSRSSWFKSLLIDRLWWLIHSRRTRARPEEDPIPTLRFGVNYTPRRGWFHSWHDFDPGRAREDLAQIAGLGPRPRPGLPPLAAAPAQPHADPHRRRRPAGAAGRPGGRGGPRRHGGRRAGPSVELRLLPGVDPQLAPPQRLHRPGGDRAPRRDLLRTLGRALAGRPNLIGLQLGNELNNLVEHNPVTVGGGRPLPGHPAGRRPGRPGHVRRAWSPTPRTTRPGTATTTPSPRRPRPARAT